MASPNLTEIATTTLRHRDKKMPSHSVKQAKTMSAIAHGWKPKGSAAGIPVKVAKEFHAADKGHKYGKGRDSQFHSPRHSPGGPANNDGYCPASERHHRHTTGGHVTARGVHNIYKK